MVTIIYRHPSPTAGSISLAEAQQVQPSSPSGGSVARADSTCAVPGAESLEFRCRINYACCSAWSHLDNRLLPDVPRYDLSCLKPCRALARHCLHDPYSLSCRVYSPSDIAAVYVRNESVPWSRDPLNGIVVNVTMEEPCNTYPIFDFATAVFDTGNLSEFLFAGVDGNQAGTISVGGCSGMLYIWGYHNSSPGPEVPSPIYRRSVAIIAWSSWMPRSHFYCRI